MPKLTGPLHSDSANGTLADWITYRRHPHGPIATRKPKTPATWTTAQQLHRTTVAGLATFFRTTTPTERATWSTLVDARQSTLWCVFCEQNLRRLRQGLEPTAVWPPITPTPPADYITLTEFSHGERYVTADWETNRPASTFNILLIYDPDAPPTSIDQQIDSVNLPDSQSGTFRSPDGYRGLGYYAWLIVDQESQQPLAITDYVRWAAPRHEATTEITSFAHDPATYTIQWASHYPDSPMQIVVLYDPNAPPNVYSDEHYRTETTTATSGTIGPLDNYPGPGYYAICLCVPDTGMKFAVSPPYQVTS